MPPRPGGRSQDLSAALPEPPGEPSASGLGRWWHQLSGDGPLARVQPMDAGSDGDGPAAGHHPIDDLLLNEAIPGTLRPNNTDTMASKPDRC
jgi:hypothetical protein